MAIRVEVWGDYACFSRPEFKVERVSYDVMTPSAARGVIEAIFYHPGLKWVIDKIYVLNPIKFTNIRRNEIKAKISARNVGSVMNGGDMPLYISAAEDIQQRASLVLKDVRYVIEAHFDMTDAKNDSDNPGKFQDIIKRRLISGKCYYQPYLGCREFPAHFRLFEGGEIPTAYPNEEKDLGFMLYDMDYSNPEDIRPLFFRAVLRNGVLSTADCEVYQ